MDDAVHAGDGLFHLVQVGEVGGNERFVRRKVGRHLDVAEPQLRVDRLQQLAQPPADVARRTRQQYTLHCRLLLFMRIGQQPTA